MTANPARARMVYCMECERLVIIDALNPTGKCTCGTENAR